MGEARELIGDTADAAEPHPDSVLGQLDSVLDDIDSALQIKLGDLYQEGTTKRAENHYKIGLMRGADTLIRRAKAMLEDAYEPLDVVGDYCLEDGDAADA